jgi:hypothetical protein
VRDTPTETLILYQLLKLVGKPVCAEEFNTLRGGG